MTKVINLFAGPGAGKSTTAAGLFYVMKCNGMKVELVTEFAKELVYERNYLTLNNQEVVSRTQAYRQGRLRGQVDYIVTDSPLLLGLHYAGPGLTTDLKDYILGEWHCYDNINFFIDRVKPYQPYGRRGSEASARQVDIDLQNLLGHAGIAFTSIEGDYDAPRKIFHTINERTLER